MREENLRRGLELKKSMNNILDGFNIGVIKVTPTENAQNKVSFCNNLCFKMLKSFICAPSYDGLTALDAVKDVEDGEARLTTELTLQEALNDVEAALQDFK